LRIFVGVGMNQPVRTALSKAAEEARALVAGRYVSQKNYHCTLAFIGQTEQEQIQEAEQALKKTAPLIEPFLLELGKLSYFRHPDNSVLFCGLSENASLKALAAQVRIALKEAGIPYDGGPFHPHITLARHAKLDAQALSGVVVPSVEMQVKKITLFESKRVEEQLRYLPLFECTLGK